MAVEIFSEKFINIMSPRISPSHDLRKPEKLPLRSNSLGSDSNPEFDFPLCKNPDQKFSHADELFSNGKILPIGIKNQSSDRTDVNGHRKIFSDKQKFNSVKNKSPVNRSKSLSCGTSLFPFSLLSQSVSEGSPRNVKHSKLVSDYGNNSQKKKNLQKANSYQKRPSRNGVGQINPVLNIPLADMFCMGSFFSIGKERRK